MKTLTVLPFVLCSCFCNAQFLNVYSNGSISHNIDVDEIDSIKIDNRINLWKTITPTIRYYYAPNWAQTSDPQSTYQNGVYTITLSKATSAQWQAQMHFITGLQTSARKRYNFRVTLMASKAVKNATIKLYQNGDDKLYYCEDRVNLTAGQEYVFSKTDMEGLDMSNLCLVLDFGGNSINTNIAISGLVLQETDYDSSKEKICPLEGYRLVWNDEFTTSAINTTKWTFQEANAGWVNHELQTYVAGKSPKGTKVAECSNGTLKIHCFKEGDKIYSGRMYGRKTVGFKYGYIEARIKLPKGKGTWPAWWMMPVSGSNWPSCGEIDIMEEVGVDANVVSSSIHCQAYNHPHNTQKTHSMTCVGAEDGFHVYALEWTENYIRTYVDGKEQLFFENDKQGNNDTWPFDKAFYPILNVAWGGDWGGYAGIDESALPVTMEVDYVRVWQKKQE